MGSSREDIAPLEVDRASLLELARGANLHAGSFACLRELVQNAVDATLLRVFVEQGAPPTNEESMRWLRRTLVAHPIDVELARIEDEGESRRYHVRIVDRGMGIARADVPHLQRIASSSKNPARAALIDAMPEWMRPSGTFGIGLQSAFLVSDTLTLRSRTLTGDAIDLVLRSANSGTIGWCDGARDEIGTTAELVVTVGPDVSPSATTLYALDPLLELDHDGVLVDAAKHAESLARESLACIRVNGRAIPRPTNEDDAYFDPETLLELWLPSDDEGSRDPLVAKGESSFRATRCTYRGLAIHAEGTLPREHPCRLDIHGSTARRMLTLSRESLSPEGRTWLAPRVLATYVRVAETRLTRREHAPRSCAWLSLHLQSVGRIDHAGPWRDIVVGDRAERATITLGDVVDAGSVTVTRARPIRAWLPSGEEIEGDRSYCFYYVMRGLSVDVADRLTLSVAPVESVSMRFAHEYLRGWGIERFGNTCRPRLPCPDAYASLRAGHRAAPLDLLRPPELGRACNLLSPWTFRDVVDLSSPERWVAWTANEYGGPPRNPSDVASNLARFLRDFDPDLRANAKLRIAYDLDRVLADLEMLYA